MEGTWDGSWLTLTEGSINLREGAGPLIYLNKLDATQSQIAPSFWRESRAKRGKLLIGRHCTFCAFEEWKNPSGRSVPWHEKEWSRGGSRGRVWGLGNIKYAGVANKRSPEAVHLYRRCKGAKPRRIGWREERKWREAESDMMLSQEVPW